MLDCEKLQPFDVLRFPYEFEGDPERTPKRFVVARNVVEAEILRCFKPTSQTEYYDDEPLRLKGVVEFLPGEIECFTDRTLIPPDTYDIPYAYIRTCHRNGELQYLNRLTDDFRERMKAAAMGKSEWRTKQKDYFFKWFVDIS
jgi:hypothetical protein